MNNEESEPFAFTTGPSAFEGIDPDDYSDLLSLATAEHAVASYQDSDKYAELCKEAGFLDGIVLSAGATQVAVAHAIVDGHLEIIISPRGSSEAADWRDDARSLVRVQWRPVLPPGLRVGWGFREQAKAIEHELLAYIRSVVAAQAAPMSVEIVVTGHSLGGALSYLLTCLLAHHGMRPIVVIAHESPRWASGKTAAWYDKAMPATHRVVNIYKGEPDLVTRIPRRALGFRHAGRVAILALVKTLHSVADWQAYRAQHRVSHIKAVQSWRVITRTVRAVTAHFGQKLLAKLRSRLA